MTRTIFQYDSQALKRLLPSCWPPGLFNACLTLARGKLYHSSSSASFFTLVARAEMGEVPARIFGPAGEAHARGFEAAQVQAAARPQAGVGILCCHDAH